MHIVGIVFKTAATLFRIAADIKRGFGWIILKI